MAADGAAYKSPRRSNNVVGRSRAAAAPCIPWTPGIILK